MMEKIIYSQIIKLKLKCKQIIAQKETSGCMNQVAWIILTYNFFKPNL